MYAILAVEVLLAVLVAGLFVSTLKLKEAAMGLGLQQELNNLAHEVSKLFVAVTGITNAVKALEARVGDLERAVPSTTNFATSAALAALSDRLTAFENLQIDSVVEDQAAAPAEPVPSSTAPESAPVAPAATTTTTTIPTTEPAPTAVPAAETSAPASAEPAQVSPAVVEVSQTTESAPPAHAASATAAAQAVAGTTQTA